MDAKGSDTQEIIYRGRQAYLLVAWVVFKSVHGTTAEESWELDSSVR